MYEDVIYYLFIRQINGNINIRIYVFIINIRKDIIIFSLIYLYSQRFVGIYLSLMNIEYISIMSFYQTWKLLLYYYYDYNSFNDHIGSLWPSNHWMNYNHSNNTEIILKINKCLGTLNYNTKHPYTFICYTIYIYICYNVL